MKNLMLPLIAALLFAACQNASTPETKNPETPAAFTVDPVQLKSSATKAKAVLQSMNDFNAELTQVSQSMTEAQKNKVENIRGQLTDVMSKQEMLTKALESADNASGKEASELTGSAVPTQTVIEDYMGSIDRYEQFLADLRAQLEDIKSGKTKDK